MFLFRSYFRLSWSALAVKCLPITDLQGRYDAVHSKFGTLGEISVPLQDLRFQVFGQGYVSVWETPHYAFLANPAADTTYPDYVARTFGRSGVEEHVKRFKTLEEELSNEFGDVVLLGSPLFPNWRKMLIVDGTHRSAVLAHLNRDSVMVAIAGKRAKS